MRLFSICFITMLFGITSKIQAQTTFNYIGSVQKYVVPSGITSIHVEAYGAEGGSAGNNYSNYNSCGSVNGLAMGGDGGYAEGDLCVTPGDTVYIYVGGKGGSGNSGGFNGGGVGDADASTTSTGGGASDVRLGGKLLSNRKLVAGGGGGAEWAGGCRQAGVGGGTTGGTGSGDNSSNSGNGGTQSSGGAAGNSCCGFNSSSGTLGFGGSAAYGHSGGGGGGYYGGGSGGVDGHGGGGSGYIGGVVNGNTTSGGNTGDGKVVITTNSSGSCSISVSPSSETYTGGISTNMYIGYGSSSSTLSASGGGTFTWSPSTNLSCSTCNSTVFTPIAAGTYILTAGKGCDICTTTICVKDIRVPNTSGTKSAVYMCHKEPVTNVTQTQAVLLRGIPGHFQYHSGDKLGVCGNTCATNKHDFDYETVVVDEQYLEVMCSPNPFRQSFKLHYISNSEAEAVVSIYGMTGNLVEKVNLAGVADEAELGSNLPNGIYTISFIQGDKNRVFRMIKVD